MLNRIVGKPPCKLVSEASQESQVRPAHAPLTPPTNPRLRLRPRQSQTVLKINQGPAIGGCTCPIASPRSPPILGRPVKAWIPRFVILRKEMPRGLGDSFLVRSGAMLYPKGSSLTAIRRSLAPSHLQQPFLQSRSLSAVRISHRPVAGASSVSAAPGRVKRGSFTDISFRSFGSCCQSQSHTFRPVSLFLYHPSTSYSSTHFRSISTSVPKYHSSQRPKDPVTSHKDSAHREEGKENTYPTTMSARKYFPHPTRKHSSAPIHSLPSHEQFLAVSCELERDAYPNLSARHASSH